MTNTTTHRWGNFSSYKIYKLMSNDSKGTGFGAAALTYIKEKAFERKLQRPINEQSGGRAAEWGTLVEHYAFQHLGLEYSIVSRDRIIHPTINNWVGVPDLISDSIVGDIKCPFVKNFCNLYEITSAEVLKKEFPEYYWQLISNAILTDRTRAELVVFCPFKDQLSEIRSLAEGENIKWITYANDSELPHLIRGAYYNNIHRITFEIYEDDCKALTERVIMANELLTIEPARV